MSRALKVSFLLVLLLLSGTLAGCCPLINLSAGPGSTTEPVTTPAEEPQEQPTAEAPSPDSPDVENPTAVGQAVDAIVRPAIEDVYGQAELIRAPTGEALIVSLWYEIPTAPSEGDGEILRDALISRGASVDPAQSDMDYHAGEEFILLCDTGNPAYKTVRVAISPDANQVYVNADRSE